MDITNVQANGMAGGNSLLPIGEIDDSFDVKLSDQTAEPVQGEDDLRGNYVTNKDHITPFMYVPNPLNPKAKEHKPIDAVFVERCNNVSRAILREQLRNKDRTTDIAAPPKKSVSVSADEPYMDTS